MPYQAALPTWLALNNVNSPYPSGQGDSVTSFPYMAGGLNLGDYFDLTNEEAAGASYPTNGLLFSGRYRYVLVDSGATAANVKTGTVGYIRAGSTVASVVVLTQGSGQTVGTYQVAATVGSGGGSGAIIQVIVTSATAITVSVVNGGFGYVSPPTFTLATGGTPGTVVAQLAGPSMNVVTSADIAIGTASLANAGIGPVHPVVFLNSITPGNYGFIQELGVATVLAGSTFTQAQGYNAVPVSGASANGTMTTAVNTYTVYSIGTVIDPITAPLAGTPFKILLNGPVVQD
jgi:hypothetical protein